MYVISKLFTPISYVRISHPEKRYFDFVLPIITSVLITLVICFLPNKVNLIGKDSLVSVVNGILQILSGFYIASMAAVSTFQKDGMDDVMKGDPPTLKGDELTRRKFLSYLFGYLAFMSIMMYFAGGAIQLVQGNLGQFELLKASWLKIGLVFIYISVICNIIYTTILGMCFMIDKMHSAPERLVIHNKKNNNQDD
ncbi:hypothetical protein [Providencia sp. PROV261]|uniref:hypothetical protein n=1 Tax=Providencia sp. PROV261 TaxID=2949949 RepID=UPI002349CD54|nr:hypothetical protein [Providencia sp. PROV261]